MPSSVHQSRPILGNALLLTTSLIWGFAFVAQRVGMDHVGPFTFNGIRFVLGAVIMLPFWRRTPDLRGSLVYGTAAGLVLFLAASLQQIGLVSTTAGNAGFITGFYVVLVPVIGLGFGHRIGARRWFSVVLALIGMYFLSVGSDFTINRGDLFVLGSAVFFAVHVLVINRVSPRSSLIHLSIVQYLVVGILSTAVGFVREPWLITGVVAALPALAFGGIGSIAIAYTLQTLAQRMVEPSHAAIVLSLEGTFAALGGWLVLREVLTPRAVVGCALMLAAMLMSQLVRDRNER